MSRFTNGPLPDVSLVGQFLQEVFAEVHRARAKFGPFSSLHEAYAVILEEVKELETITFSHDDRVGNVALRNELIQIAAMSCCAYMECTFKDENGVEPV